MLFFIFGLQSGNSPSQYVSYGNHSSGNIAGKKDN